MKNLCAEISHKVNNNIRLTGSGHYMKPSIWWTVSRKIYDPLSRVGNIKMEVGNVISKRNKT